MLFGIPWPGIVAIVAIAGGLIYAFKEKELQMEEKRMVKSRELNEMRQIIHNLKSRVDSLEAKVSASDKRTSQQEKNPLSDIEIEDESERQNNDNDSSRTKSRA